ncbi:YtxH domain-containing protein [Arcticibacter sp.]|jgi:hypothetical protein|uniref:YtxH domain-containing protein n=1 Tax=Arcticibacter sp. TaxID=1872630 RepID=UPI00388FE0D4
MGLLRYIVLGAAVAAGVKYATKKRPDGKSFIDDISEKAPEWMNQAKKYTDQIKDQYGAQKPTHRDYQ